MLLLFFPIDETLAHATSTVMRVFLDEEPAPTIILVDRVQIATLYDRIQIN